MIKKYRELFKRNYKEKLIENFFSLSVLQAANYILPLITLPYLVRILGPEKFGLIAFAQAFIYYFMMLTDFGFNLSATREISINRDDEQKVLKIFSSVFLIKGILLLLSFFIIIMVVTFFDKFSSEKEVYYLTSLSIIGWVMFPQWYFQGIENMKFVTFFNIGAKLFFTISVFIFIRQSSDYVVVPLLNSLGLIVAGAISLFISFKYFKIVLVMPRFSDIELQFKEGWHIFISNMSINLYTTSNTVLLGILTNNTYVGYYSAAERIYKGFHYLGLPAFQALFPYLSKLFVDNKNRALDVFNKLFKISIIIAFLMSLTLSILSPYIIALFLGDNFTESKIIFSLLSWVILLGWGNYVLGIHGLVNFGHKKVFSKIVLLFGLLHICFVTIGIVIWGYLIVPIVWIITELVIFITMYLFLKKVKIIY